MRDLLNVDVGAVGEISLVCFTEDGVEGFSPRVEHVLHAGHEEGHGPTHTLDGVVVLRWSGGGGVGG